MTQQGGITTSSKTAGVLKHAVHMLCKALHEHRATCQVTVTWHVTHAMPTGRE